MRSLWWMMGLGLLGSVGFAGCQDTNSGSCRNYVQAFNQCAREMGGGAGPLTPLTADAYCLAFGLPGVPRDPDLIESFNCQADSYREADCSSEERFDETFRDVCDDVPDADEV